MREVAKATVHHTVPSQAASERPFLKPPSTTKVSQAVEETAVAPWNCASNELAEGGLHRALIASVLKSAAK